MDFRREIIHPILCCQPDVGLPLIPTSNKTVNCQNCQHTCPAAHFSHTLFPVSACDSAFPPINIIYCGRNAESRKKVVSLQP